jgi:hypothetical protein
MRIIVLLEATAEEFRLREERRIWGDINILILNVQGQADKWLIDETNRINYEISIAINVIVNDGQLRVDAQMHTTTLWVEQ